MRIFIEWELEDLLNQAIAQQLEKRGQNCLSCASMKHHVYADVVWIEAKGQILR